MQYLVKTFSYSAPKLSKRSHHGLRFLLGSYGRR